jgi:2-keto-4-pentenoate hydratase/2-oxohepta-3-ene-1,7-dioic acid hydratase in catechol pathway
MNFLSYVHGSTDRIGALTPRGEIIDLTARLKTSDLGAALRAHGPDRLRDLAAQASCDLAVDAIESWRPAVADPLLIACVGLNYEEHRVEAGRARTANPTIFLRTPASQTGHLSPLVVPPEEPEGLDYEAEIAVVIGRGGRRIRTQDAWSHVFGVSCYNDASARKWQAHSTQWTSGKNFPSTGAFGPVVATEGFGPDRVLTLETRLNGVVLQRADTSMMIFSIPELIAYVSTFSALVPGDVIVSGTPGGVGFKRTPPVLMRAGDTVEVEVKGVGVLRNPVINEVAT